MTLATTTSRTTSGGATEAVIDLSVVKGNVQLIRRLRPRLGIMAVVKANAFGHGAVEVSQAALEAGAAWLGVARGDEALQLRDAGLTAPILAWSDPPIGLMATAGVDVSVATQTGLDEAAAAPTPPHVHLKLDTGLHRGGSMIENWTELVRAAARYEAQHALTVRGIWSHLSHGDDATATQTRGQLTVLRAGVGLARRLGLNPRVVHLTNTAGTLNLEAPDLDLARIGAGLYGIDELGVGLRPAMRLVTKVVQVRRIKAGDGVSYGHDFVAGRNTTIGLLPLGYADGIPRLSGLRASVMCRGVLMPVAGRVSMDHVTIDAGDVPIAPGDEVVVFGDGLAGEPTVADWADWSFTIPHEIYCGVSRRVRRRYVDGTVVR